MRRFWMDCRLLGSCELFWWLGEKSRAQNPTITRNPSYVVPSAVDVCLSRIYCSCCHQESWALVAAQPIPSCRFSRTND